MLNKGCLAIHISLSGEELLSDNRSFPHIGSLSKVNTFINLDVLYKRVTSTVFRSSPVSIVVLFCFSKIISSMIFMPRSHILGWHILPPFNNPSQKRRDNGRYKVVTGLVDLKCSWANVYHFLISFQDLKTTLHVTELHPLGSFFLKEGSALLRLNNFILISTGRILEI